MKTNATKMYFIQFIFQLNILLFFASFLFDSCRKTDSQKVETFNRVTKPDSVLVYSTSLLDSISSVNKTSSWYTTNKSFDEIFDEKKSSFVGFELTSENHFIPFCSSSSGIWSPTKNYYWYSLGSYVYTDLNGDGKKDLWAFFWKSPWPTNSRGLHFYSDCLPDTNHFNVQLGLTEVRKTVLADLNNDGKKEIVLFSTGYDGNPFPCDSIAIFLSHIKDLSISK